MNIWFLNHYAEGPDGQATRTFDLGRELVRRGHRVSIFASSFSHYKLVETRLGAREKWRTEDVDGVRFIWQKTAPYRTNDWRRAFNVASYFFSAITCGRRLDEQPDVIVGTCVHPLAPLAAYLLSRRTGAKFVYEVTDLWPKTLVDMGVMGARHPVAIALSFLEKRLFRRAALIITLLPYVADYLNEIGCGDRKWIWIPNGVNVTPDREWTPVNGRPGSFVVMYVGGFSQYHRLENVLEAAATLGRNGGGVRFVFIGDGTTKAAVKARAAEMRLENVEFHDSIPKREVFQRLQEADALLYMFRKLDVLRFGMSPVKLFDYLLAGRPIVYGAQGRNNPVAEAGAGVTVDPESPSELAQAISAIAAMPVEQRNELGRRGREYVRTHHDVAVLARRLEAAFQEMQ